MINQTCYAFLSRRTAIRKGLERAIKGPDRYKGPKALKVMFDYSSSGLWDAKTGTMVGLGEITPYLPDRFLQAFCAWHVEVESRAWAAMSQVEKLEQNQACLEGLDTSDVFEYSERDLHLEKQGFWLAQCLAFFLKCDVYYRTEVTSISCGDLPGCWHVQAPYPELFYRPGLKGVPEAARLSLQEQKLVASKEEFQRFSALLDSQFERVPDFSPIPS